ncbi:MAG: radical SAM protein, partial [Salibacteraceae bacterium]
MSIGNNLRILSHWNIKKLAYAVATFASYFWSKSTGLPSHWGYPMSLSIEPTTACNLKCPECPSGLRNFTRPTGKLDPDVLESILVDVKAYCSYI